MQSNSNGPISTTDSNMTSSEQQQDTTKSMPDLERLGMERPQAFSGLWPELAFCFSTVMSQILAVSRYSVLSERNHLTYCPEGILHIRVQRPSPNSRKRTRYTGSLDNMDHHRSLACRHLNTSYLWPLDRHVRWLCRL